VRLCPRLLETSRHTWEKGGVHADGEGELDEGARTPPHKTKLLHLTTPRNKNSGPYRGKDYANLEISGEGYAC
jgi:hypothetical protein